MKLTSEADSWPAVEWQECPSGPEPVPAFGDKVAHAVAVDFGESVHCEHAVHYRGTLADEERGHAVGASASRKGGVDGGVAGVGWDDWVQAEGWVRKVSVNPCPACASFGLVWFVFIHRIVFIITKRRRQNGGHGDKEDG